MVNATLSNRATQANLLLCWKFDLVNAKNRYDRNLLSERCPSLLTMFQMAINRLSPKDFGKFLAVTRKCVLQITYWLMTPTTDSQLFNDCTRLRDYYYLRCREDMILDMGNGALQEIALCVKELKRLEPIRFPERKDPDDIWHFYYRFFDAVIDEHQKAFHATYSFGHFVSLSKGYRQEMLAPVELAPRSAPTVPVPSEAPLEISSRSVEARIPPNDFCRPTKTVPNGKTCPVCAEDIKDGAEGESVVVTKCRHYYHNQCLDSWVNDSGMNNSHTCPACRTVL